MEAITINTIGKDDWDRLVLRLPGATFAHLYGWKDVIEGTYANPCYFFECRVGNDLAGILPMVHLKSLLFGNQLVSMPYLDTGGPLFTEKSIGEKLMVAVQAKAAELEADICLRSLDEELCDWSRQTEKVTMYLQLQQDPEQMLKVFSSERRNRIKKAAKNGLTVTFHREEALDVFYRIFAENMRDLGSPVHSKLFFKRILTTFKDEAGLLIVQDPHGKHIGAGLYFRFADLLALPWVSSLRDSFKLNPNIIMYWELIKYGCLSGAKTFDFGRSTIDSGTFEYKRQWGAETVPLYWYLHSARGNNLTKMSPASKRNQIMIASWKKLPLSIANTVGPILRKSISL